MALSHLQYLFHIKSSTKDLSHPIFEYTCYYTAPGGTMLHFWAQVNLSLYSISNIGVKRIVDVQSGFGLRGVQP